MSDIKSKRRTPPPPETRVRGSGGVAISGWLETKVKTPDWEYWRNRRELKVLEAAALSCNIDPEGHDDIINDREVRKRIRLLLDHLSDRAFFTPGTLNMGDASLNGVKLSEFSAWWIQTFGIKGIPEELAKIGEPLVLERQSLAKQLAGGYTIKEAAEHLERAGARFEHMMQKLKDAARSGVLPVYERGTKTRYEYGAGYASDVRDSYEEAYWNDLNKWLAENEQRIEYRFPAPTALHADDKLRTISDPPDAEKDHLATSSEDGSITNGAEIVQQEPPKGITKKQVIIAFQDYYFNADQWKKYLADPAPWLKKCRLQKGGKSKNHPSLWSPVGIAIELIDKPDISIKKMDAVFVAHTFLKLWAEIWTDRTRFLR